VAKTEHRGYFYFIIDVAPKHHFYGYKGKTFSI